MALFEKKKKEAPEWDDSQTLGAVDAAVAEKAEEVSDELELSEEDVAEEFNAEEDGDVAEEPADELDEELEELEDVEAEEQPEPEEELVLDDEPEDEELEEAVEEPVIEEPVAEEIEEELPIEEEFEEEPVDEFDEDLELEEEEPSEFDLPLEPADEIEGEPEEEFEEEHVEFDAVCPHCGAPIESTSRFCRICGKKLGNDSRLARIEGEQAFISAKDIVVPEYITRGDITIVRVVDGKYELVQTAGIPVKIIDATEEEAELLKMDNDMKAGHPSLADKVRVYNRENEKLDAIKEKFHVDTVADLNEMPYEEMDKYFAVKDVDERLLGLDIPVDTAVEMTKLTKEAQKTLGDALEDLELDNVSVATVKEIAEIKSPKYKDMIIALRRDIKRANYSFIEETVNKLQQK